MLGGARQGGALLWQTTLPLQRSRIVGAMGSASAAFHTTIVRRASSSSSSPRFVHEHEHVPLSRTHKLALTLGSLFASFYNPARGDMIALLSELSGEPLLPKLRDMMHCSAEGRALLMERPTINTQSVNMDYLGSLDECTFGKQYWRWLKWCNVGPDTRAKVSVCTFSSSAVR